MAQPCVLSLVPPTERSERPEIWITVVPQAQMVPMRRDIISIGSGAFNDVAISDRYVSKNHCCLYWKNGKLWIEDANSEYGTWLNGVRVEMSVLEKNATILIGETALEVIGLDNVPNPRGIIGEHPKMHRVFRQIRRYGATENAVLVAGETGTGKELVARALHDASLRRDGPFEAVNCAAIPKELAESELFGHVQGAFTGATRTHEGLFQRADGGTLFLDEIGEMSLELQSKLLRVLEDGCVRPVGGAREIQVDVRVIAATNRDLEKDVTHKRFRLDLYHRLAVGIIEVPPLRDRRSDIRRLVETFLEQIPPDTRPTLVSPEVFEMLEKQHWPGNVRSLRCALNRATMNGGPILRASDFFFLERAPVENRTEGYVRFSGRPFQEVRREIYQRVLQAHHGNRTAAAQALGIPKSTFSDQVRALDL